MLTDGSSPFFTFFGDVTYAVTQNIRYWINNRYRCIAVGWGSGPDWDFRVDYLVGAAARVGAGLARVGVVTDA